MPFVARPRSKDDHDGMSSGADACVPDSANLVLCCAAMFLGCGGGGGGTTVESSVDTVGTSVGVLASG